MKEPKAEHYRLRAPRLAELRAEIKKGLKSGESTPLDVDAIKERGWKLLAMVHREAGS